MRFSNGRFRLYWLRGPDCTETCTKTALRRLKQVLCGATRIMKLLAHTKLLFSPLRKSIHRTCDSLCSRVSWILILCSFFFLDDATVFQREDAVSAVEDAIVVGNEQCGGTPCLTHALQKIDDIRRAVFVQGGCGLVR